MTWLDVVLAFVLAGIAFLEMYRGFGRAVLDTLAAYGALCLADTCANPLAANLHLSPHPTINLCVTFGVLVIVFGVFALLLSQYAWSVITPHTGMFEGILGLAAGLGLGMIVAHSIVRVLVLSDPSGQAASFVSGGFISNEMLSFATYHNVMNSLSDLTAPHDGLSGTGS